MAGSAAAASYPPALGCGVSGFASAGSGSLSVRGIGFAAGAQVLVTVGASTGTVRADPAGSFQASWLVSDLAAGTTVSASASGCSASGTLTIENQQNGTGNSALPPTTPDPGSAAKQPGAAVPSQHSKARSPASQAHPEPSPPARRADPVAAAIPSVPLSGLPPQLFLGLAGAVLLAGAALTGLTGRLGHRGDRRSSSEISVASPLARNPDLA